MQTRTLRSLRRIALLALVSVAVTACDDDDDPTGPPSAAGTYNIASIQQEGLAACTLGTTGCTIENTGTEVIVVEDGQLVLSANGTFTIVVNGTVDDVDEELGSASGTWVRTQNGVTLTVTGFPVPVAGTFSTAAAEELVFTVPASLFSDTATGNVTITFDKQ
ncbi:MAG TPA: hypothetical protein VK922_10225 [Gemmatimonadaceae bacterium]|nr:hypothetical protein [Gemmatimonadaceae bacterium]